MMEKSMLNQGPLILIIEDDEDINENLQQILEDEGYQTVGVGHGKEALDYLLHPPKKPNLILLDLMMPVMDGRKFLDQFHSQTNEKKLNIPIVLLTAAGDKLENVTDQVQALLKKPIELEELLETVDHYCGRLVSSSRS